jgi:hypothetical protein
MLTFGYIARNASAHNNMRLFKVSEPTEFKLPEIPGTGLYSGRASSTWMFCALATHAVATANAARAALCISVLISYYWSLTLGIAMAGLEMCAGHSSHRGRPQLSGFQSGSSLFEHSFCCVIQLPIAFTLSLPCYSSMAALLQSGDKLIVINGQSRRGFPGKCNFTRVGQEAN